MAMGITVGWRYMSNRNTVNFRKRFETGDDNGQNRVIMVKIYFDFYCLTILQIGQNPRILNFQTAPVFLSVIPVSLYSLNLLFISS